MKPTLDDLLHNSLIATDIPSEELNERILNQSTQKEVVPMRKKETKKPWKMAQTAAAVALLVLVTGCGVYAAERILAQKQIAIIDNLWKMSQRQRFIMKNFQEKILILQTAR